jgi:putative spermidine/putrescine transport system substrate-binding protein
VSKNHLGPNQIYLQGVGNVALATGLAYRKDKFPGGGPKSWADFWDVKRFPGNRSLYNRSFTAMSYALLADGVAPDKLYPMDMDRAFRKLGEIKPHIKVWWTQANQSQQLIRDGEVDMIAMWNARANELAEQGVPLESCGTRRRATTRTGSSRAAPLARRTRGTSSTSPPSPGPRRTSARACRTGP